MGNSRIIKIEIQRFHYSDNKYILFPIKLLPLPRIIS